MRLRSQDLLLLICASAALILLANLGLAPLWGSEGRWAVIARSMLTSGDIFNPLLGIDPYWDKPLLSYWQILPLAYLLGGVSEFAARLPSSLWALIMLVLTYDLAKRRLDTATALISAALLCTTLGFVFWGRNAQVEMTNAAVILLSIWYFLRHKSDKTHSWIFVLGALMAIGANMKGLTAIAVPIFCILLLSLVKRDWSWFPPLKVLIPALIVSAGVFITLPLLASLFFSSWEPLRLVWKENVVRFFHPFDHKDPFYVYCYRIFDLAAPWSLFLPPALFRALKDARLKHAHIRDILLIFGAIFLFFTLSGSRRPYYILPILPFASILVADCFMRFMRGELTPGLQRITTMLGLLLALILAVPLPALIMKPAFLPQGVEGLLPLSVVFFICAVLLAIGFLKRYSLGIIAPVMIVWFGFVLVVVPWTVRQPGNLRSDVAHVASMHKPVALLFNDAKTIYYLNRPYEVQPDLEKAHIWARRTGGILITADALQDESWVCIIDSKKWKAYQLSAAPSNNAN